MLNSSSLFIFTLSHKQQNKTPNTSPIPFKQFSKRNNKSKQQSSTHTINNQWVIVNYHHEPPCLNIDTRIFHPDPIAILKKSPCFVTECKFSPISHCHPFSLTAMGFWCIAGLSARSLMSRIWAGPSDDLAWARLCVLTRNMYPHRVTHVPYTCAVFSASCSCLDSEALQLLGTTE